MTEERKVRTTINFDAEDKARVCADERNWFVTKKARRKAR